MSGFIRHLLCVFVILCGTIHASDVVSSGSEQLFRKTVSPILQRRCLSCHHDGESKGDFSLSNGESLLSSDFVDTDHVESSYLLKLVTPVAGQAEMPQESEPLSMEEIQAIRTWIRSGASWPKGYTLEPVTITDHDWWSLLPIADYSSVVSGIEAKEDAKLRRNPVDHFVDAKLSELMLTPVEQANPHTLIRRLTYDLTGLPPTPAEVSSFVKSHDHDPEGAWKAAVDRLIDSPAFGEKWAQHWLDVVRYAETHGYDKDKPRRHAWPYRDYVIRSFNDDKPYSRFVQEQVAGDVLYPGDPDGVLGLGFLAAGPWDFIGHREVGEAKLDGRIAKHLDRDEMVSAVFNVFMSTTVQCAQCHHHKFDPISMEDYYRLHAVFAAVDRADRVYDGLSPKQQKRKNEVHTKINALQSAQEALTTKLNRQILAKASGIDRRIAELTEKYGTGTELKPQYGYHSLMSKDPNETKWVQLDLKQQRSVEEVRIIPAFDMYNGIGAGFGFPVRYRVEAADDAAFQQGVRLLLDATDKDQPNPKTKTVVVSGDGKPIRFLRVVATKLRERRNDFIFAIGEIEAVNEGAVDNFARHAIITAKDSIESGLRWSKSNLVDGIYYRELNNRAARDELHQLRARREKIEKETRPAGTHQKIATINEQVKRLNEELKSIPDGQMVYAAATHFPRGARFTATEGKPRAIHLLYRGDLRFPGDPMLPGAPPLWSDATARFDAMGKQLQGAVSQNTNAPDLVGESIYEWNEGTARAELARYLTDKNNPLVWRSIANRLWLWTFGAPLVGSPNDFGRGGMQPTHPELLDFLAVRLRDDPDQSLKSMVRLLFESNAYRRSSRVVPAMAERDAENLYLWRATRRRLTAEEFRDSALAVAGVLKQTMGGKSFQDFVIEKPQHSPHYEYHLHDPADPTSHRRSVYRFVVRSQPQPLLTTLDCADPSISTPRRDESTTALQALAAWNNRLVEFTAGELGARLQRESKAIDQQVAMACRLVLGRDPMPTEQEILRKHTEHYGSASLARVLFNLNAFAYLD